jgi:hypothetical protein
MICGQNLPMPLIPSNDRRSVRTQAAQERDAAFARISSARRGAIFGAAGLSAGFAALVYALAPGHSLSAAKAATPATSRTTVPSSSARTTAAAMPPAAGPGALGLGGPQSAPTPGTSGSSSSSGSSGGSDSGNSGSSSAATPAPAPAAAPSPPVVSGGS